MRRMLKSGQAVPVTNVPFTIRLTYVPQTQACQLLTAGFDLGRTNIGISAVRQDGRCLYLARCETRNREIPKLMAKQKQHCQASRRGERLVRKYLAKKLGTTMDGILGRILPGATVFHEGKQYILSGRLSGGASFRMLGCGEKNFTASRCTVVQKNRGLVYVN